MVGWIEDHSSKLTAQRAAKEAFSRFLTAISNSAGAKGAIYLQISPEHRWFLLEQPNLATSSYAHPTISTLTDPLLSTWAGRSIVLAGWLALGWFLVER